MYRYACIVIIAPLVFHFVNALEGNLVTLSTPSGAVRGVEEKTTSGIYRRFLGIPYAQPPVGKLRFEKPQPLSEAWPGVWDATRVRPECLQRRGNIPAVPWGSQDESATAEDCLYLNVWTAAPVGQKSEYDEINMLRGAKDTCPLAPGASQTSRGNQLHPVMVWIHGGSFRIGSGSLRNYDGAALALRKQVVVVTFNYRLGAFGFLYGGNRSSVLGNMGLWDQLAALQWVNRNIASFGGDPSQVTLFGESVGGISSGYHALSMQSKGLFQRIIMESGVPNWPPPLQSEDDAVRNVRCIAENAGCGSDFTVEEALSCLRGLSDGSVIAKAELSCFSAHLMTLMPREGDALVPQEAGKSLLEGRIQEGMSVLLGTNANEGLIVPYIFVPGASATDQFPFTYEIAKNVASALLAGFPADVRQSFVTQFNNSDVLKLMNDLFGNFLLDCSTQYFAESFGDRIPVYLYSFDYTSQNSGLPVWTRATHTMEIPFVFGIPFLDTDKYTDADRKMSEVLMESFTNFAKTGNPSSEDVEWPNFTSHSPKFVRFTSATPAVCEGDSAGLSELTAQGQHRLAHVEDGVVYSTGCEIYRPFIGPR